MAMVWEQSRERPGAEWRELWGGGGGLLLLLPWASVAGGKGA